MNPTELLGLAIANLQLRPSLERVFSRDWVEQDLLAPPAEGRHPVTQRLVAQGGRCDDELDTLAAVFGAFDWSSPAMREKMSDLTRQKKPFHKMRAFSTVTTELYFAKFLMNLGHQVQVTKQGPDLLVQKDGVVQLAAEMNCKLQTLPDAILLDGCQRLAQAYHYGILVHLAGQPLSESEADELLSKLEAVLAGGPSRHAEAVLTPFGPAGPSVTYNPSEPEIARIISGAAPFDTGQIADAVEKNVREKASNPNQTGTGISTILVVGMGAIRKNEVLQLDSLWGQWTFPQNRMPAAFDAICCYWKQLSAEKPRDLRITVSPTCRKETKEFCLGLSENVKIDMG